MHDANVHAIQYERVASRDNKEQCAQPVYYLQLSVADPGEPMASKMPENIPANVGTL